MGNYIRKYNIPTYVSTTTYSKYDVVKVIYENTEYYFVSKHDNNLENLDDGSLSSNDYWMRFGDLEEDFSDVWAPTYQSSATLEPRVINSVFDEGTTLIKTDGINTLFLKFQLNFENVSDKEAFSLLCFCEYLGVGNRFFWRTPEPYEKRLLFNLTAAKHTYVKKNFNHVMVGIEGASFTYLPVFVPPIICDSEDNFGVYSDGEIVNVNEGICWGGEGNFTFLDIITGVDDFDDYLDGTITLVNAGERWLADGTFLFLDIELCTDDFSSYPDGAIATLTGGSDWVGDGTFI